MQKTYQVSNAVELQEAFEKAVGGDTIEMAGGEYGALDLNRFHYDSELTIKSADPNDKATFTQIKVYEGSNFTFDSVNIIMQADDNSTVSTPLFQVWNTQNVILRNSYIEGDLPVNGDDPNIATTDRTNAGIDGLPIGKGVIINYSDNVVIENTEMTNLYSGTQVSNVDGVKFLNNYIHDLRVGPFSGLNVQNIEIIGNHYSTPNPWKLGGTGDHGNLVHYFTSPNQSEPSSNIIIKDNFWEQGATSESALFGIYLDDNGYGVGYKDVVIENNIIHNGDSGGIVAENIDGLTIISNTLVDTQFESSKAPGINLFDNTRNVTIDNNILARVNLLDGIDANANNIQILDNYYVQNEDRFAEHYQGDVFVNGLTPDGERTDFIVIPGSDAEGYGAMQDALGTDGVYIAVISDSTGAGLRLKRINLEVDDIYGPNGKIDLTDAEVTWTYPDGAVETGLTSRHKFDDAGLYTVDVSIELPSGETFEAQKTVSVIDPFALRAGYNKNLSDRSDNTNDVDTTGSVQLVDDEFGKALRLVDDNSRVSYEANEEIQGNPEFSISMAFKKDGAPEDVDGNLVYFSGSAHLSTNKDKVSLTAFTTGGDKVALSVSDDAINDGNWHHVTYTFSSSKGEAKLYLDGVEVDSASGLTGVQQNLGSHSLHLGGLFGGSFGGLIDRVKFVRTELSAEKVAKQAAKVVGDTAGATKSVGATNSTGNDADGTDDALIGSTIFGPDQSGVSSVWMAADTALNESLFTGTVDDFGFLG